jgi:hypothetical protein
VAGELRAVIPLHPSHATWMEVLFMTRREHTAHDPAADQVQGTSQEPDAEEIHDLPSREAMSILTGFPSVPGLPAGILGGGGALPTDGAAPGDQAALNQADPSATPGDLNTISPTNDVSSTNVDSAGTTEATGATQDVPIVQR